jgi:hypothetical protein
MWFYGLSYQRGTPPWVSELLRLVCREPRAVAPLFRDGLPDDAKAARMAFFRYRFTAPDERGATGAWWKREPAGATRALECALTR